MMRICPPPQTSSAPSIRSTVSSTARSVGTRSVVQMQHIQMKAILRSSSWHEPPPKRRGDSGPACPLPLPTTDADAFIGSEFFFFFFFFFESIQGYITVPKCSLHERRYRVWMYAVMRLELRCRCEAEGRANRPRRGTSSRVPTYHPSRVAWGRGAGDRMLLSRTTCRSLPVRVSHPWVVQRSRHIHGYFWVFLGKE
jgi:hypothetical protein